MEKVSFDWIVWRPMSFKNSDVQIWKVLCYFIFIQTFSYFSVSSLGAPINTLFLLIISSSFLFILFYFHVSHWILSNDLSLSSLIVFSVWSSLLLKLLLNSLVQWLYSSASKFVWYFFRFSVSLLYISFCSCMIFLIALNCLCVVSCSSLTIFIIVLWILCQVVYLSPFCREVRYWNFTVFVCVCLVHFSLFLSDSCSPE